MLHTGIATVRSDRAFISRGLGEINARVFEAIHAGENLRPDHATEWLVTGIGSAIVNVPRGNGGDHAILVEGYARIAERSLIAVGTGGHVLGTCFHPLDRPSASFLRSQRDYGHLRIICDFYAKAAADVGSLHTNSVDVYIEMGREKLYGKRRKGIVAGIVDVIVFLIPFTDDDIVLERRAGEAMKMQPVNMDDRGRILKSLFHITVFEDSIPDFVGASFLMQDAFIFQRLFGIQHGFQRLILNLNEFSGIVRDTC